MRFAQFLRCLSGSSHPKHSLAPYRLTIVGSSHAIQSMKSPVYQYLLQSGVSVSKAHSTLEHEGKNRYTSLTIHGTAQRVLPLSQLAQELGQKEGIHRVHLDS